MDLFFELIQIVLGGKEQFDKAPTREEWSKLFDLSVKQALAVFKLIL